MSLPPNSGRLPHLTIIALAAIVTGCCPNDAPTIHRPANPTTIIELGAIQPETDELAQSTPVIDVHVHTFNARYLPLRGIALGKRDKFTLTQLLPDSVAIVIARAIAAAAPLSPIPQTKAGIAQAPVQSLSTPQLMRATETITDEQGRTRELSEQEKNHPALRAVRKLLAKDRPDAEARLLNPERTAKRTTAQALDQRDSDLGDVRSDELKALQQLEEIGDLSFLDVLRSPDGKMESLFTQTFGPGVKLMVSHMMDLGPVYDQKPDDENLFIDFQSQQIPRYAYFQTREDSRMVYFVAYNPYRDHWPKKRDGKYDPEKDKALAIVKDALENRGALGVKIYPPSGYRPADNRIPGKPWALFTPYPGRQWDARYRHTSGEILDQQLRALLKYCEANDVPVLVHCAAGEFEARRKYGLQMADPQWWKKYLEDNSPNGELCKLRLVFGHAGDDVYWFGSGNEDLLRWGETVRDLCVKYPNVYCEFGALGDIVEPDRQAYFVDHVAGLIAQTPKLADKMMYGSDWNMDTAIKAGRGFLQGYQRAFLHSRLRDHYRKFFFDNAVEFLTLRSEKTRARLPEEVTKRIRLLAPTDP